MKDFFIQYLSNISAGLTLGLLGYASYKIYRATIKVNQKNKTGSNVINNISTQINNYNSTEKNSEDIINKALK
jgi:hypothetical protein